MIVDTKWAGITTQAAFERAMAQVRGPLQSNLVLGLEPWTGKRDKRARERLLSRFEKAGLTIDWELNKQGQKRIILHTAE